MAQPATPIMVKETANAISAAVNNTQNPEGSMRLLSDFLGRLQGISDFMAGLQRESSDVTCKVRIVNATAFDAPQYATPGAAAADLRAHLGVPCVLEPGGYMTVPTGLSLAIPPGYVGKVCSRSGLAATRGVAVLNAPGLVDSDYRGEVRVVLINHGKDPFEIKPGDRIAQITFERVARAEFLPVAQLDANETERGAGGFGSTGVESAKRARTFAE